jgi:hypothetical protein
MKILCYGCEGKKVDARLTDGEEIYPHREDLYGLPFWVCDGCGNFVGCHHKTEDRTRPLGCIVTKAIKTKRIGIHAILDPLWKSGTHKRSYIYKWLSRKLGRTYHTGSVRNMEDVRKVKTLLKEFKVEHHTA